MPDSLHLLVCGAYYRETEAVVRRAGWADVAVHTYPTVCMLPKLQDQLEATIHELHTRYRHFAIIGTCPVVYRLKNLPSQVTAAAPNALPQCFYALTNQEIVDRLVFTGGYLITASWLDQWEQRLRSWGFDQATAQSFFHECVQNITLLDSGVTADSQQKLAEMGDYLDLPVDQVSVGLDYFERHITEIVQHWRWSQAEKKHVEEIAELKQRLANYALVVDLLPNFTRSTSEQEVIRQVLEAALMLFSPGDLHYLEVRGGQAGGCQPEFADDQARAEFTRWAEESTEEFAWTGAKTGFYLRFANQNETLGALSVADVAFPQYLRQYLNLGISIAGVCAMAAANARAVQRLQESQRSALHEKEISDTLCQVLSEITAHYEQVEVLRRILLSFYRVIPFSEAAVFFISEGYLNFQLGLTFSAHGEMTAYQPAVRALPADDVFHQSFTRVLVDLAEVPNLCQMIHAHAAGTWIGIPLLAESQVFGILSVVSPGASRYGQNEITLAQTFARSIESAHIFNKASIQASIDPLTGICNRRSLFQLAQREFETAAFVGSSLAVLMIDVDHFKRVNDTFGHAGGDVVLRAIAEMCQKHTRSLDLLGRYGGEEFILVLPDTLPNHAHQIAERLRQEISEMVTPTDQGDARVQVSIGLACLDDTCPDLETLVKHSDHALYQAKQRGRNRVETWSAAESGAADGLPSAQALSRGV